MTDTALRDPAFSDALITEAVRWAEQNGPLDDAQVMRIASSFTADSHGQVTERALRLGERIGLQTELNRARQWAPWVLLSMVALIVFAGLGLAGNVVGGGERHINVIVALVSLLGLHALTLLAWLVGLWMPPGTFGSASLGWIWLSLTARVAGGRRGQAPLLVRAATGLLSRARLLPWAFGLVSHGIWALSFAVVLAAMLFALAFRSYTLSWETTILDPAFFVQAVQALGWVPAKLGFPVPDAATVLAAAPGAAGQRTWALWLTGCIVVYGLLPRVALVLWSAAMWRSRRKALQPDWREPYYRTLLARFAAMAPAAIVDADPGRTQGATPAGLSDSQLQDLLFVVGFELPPDTPWPPPALSALPAAAAAQVQRIDGSAPSRRALLDQLARVRPRTVLLVCHAASSPDRGTERFLREVLAHCGECRLWLADAPHAGATQRWLDWLQGTGLQRVAAGDSLAAALRPTDAPTLTGTVTVTAP